MLHFQTKLSAPPGIPVGSPAKSCDENGGNSNGPAGDLSCPDQSWYNGYPSRQDSASPGKLAATAVLLSSLAFRDMLMYLGHILSIFWADALAFGERINLGDSAMLGRHGSGFDSGPRCRVKD